MVHMTALKFCEYAGVQTDAAYHFGILEGSIAVGLCGPYELGEALVDF